MIRDNLMAVALTATLATASGRVVIRGQQAVRAYIDDVAIMVRSSGSGLSA